MFFLVQNVDAISFLQP